MFLQERIPVLTREVMRISVLTGEVMRISVLRGEDICAYMKG